MFFKNLTLYRFAEGVIASAESLATAMADQRLRDVGPLELSTLGFVSPFGRDSDALTHTVGPYTLLALGEQERILPSSVINDELADRLSTIHEREGRRVGGKERKRIKEEIISDFLPRAFVRTRRTLAYVDLANGWLVVDTSSRKVGEAFVSHIREAIGSFPAIPMAPMESPRVLMTDWLVNAKLPEHLALGEECELRDPAEAGAIVRARRQDLESDEVREHLKSGKQAYVLGLVYNEHLSFALAEDLTVKKLRFLDIVLDQLGEGTAESNYAELDATFALMTLELANLLEYLEPLFGLAREPQLRLDGGDAPRHMRRETRAIGIDAATDAQLDAALARDPGMYAAVKQVKRERLEKAVKITAKLYEARDSARLLLGDKYPARMRQYGTQITAYAAKHGISPIAAATAMANDPDAPDTWPIVILAAAVEMTEPSAASPIYTEGS